MAQVLSRLAGSRVYFEPMWGNNGDRLIELGSKRALEKVSVDLCDQQHRAEAIVVNGAGYLSDGEGIQYVASLAAAYESVPFVLLPSSFDTLPDAFVEAVTNRQASSWVFARERYSHEILHSALEQARVNVGLDHDMALQLRPEDLSIGPDTSQDGRIRLLVVNRSDNESASGSVAARRWPGGRAKDLVPTSLKRRVKRRIAGWRARQLAQADAVVRRMVLSRYGATPKKVVAADISDPGQYTFDEFVRLIGQADVVVSDRLHVGLLGAILGKDTYLRPSSYHKVVGVYEYSLASYRNVTFVDGSESLEHGE